MSGAGEALTVAASIGCGLVGGVFFAFSSFVMPALDRLPAPGAVAAMQSINRLAVTPLFMTALFGTALACLVVGVWAALSLDEPEAPWVLGGALLYLLGNVAVTMGGNVPLNDALDRADAEGPRAVAAWSAYCRPWSTWNHVRTVTALAAAALLIVGLLQG